MGNGVSADTSGTVVKEDVAIRPLVKPFRILTGSRNSKPRLRSNGSRRFGRWVTSKTLRHSPKACQKSEEASERCIEHTSDFAALYRLGCDVAQLSKTGTRLRYASRISDGVEVVVKIYFKGRDGHECALASSDDETEWRATMMRVLNLPEHPGIAAIHAVLEDARAYYVVMERIAGLDLFEVLRRERLSVEDVRVVLRQLLGALAVLHSRGLVHKDLKLENVMLDRGDDGEAIRVKLIDFDTLTPWSAAAARDVLGSDQYIAPEAYDGWYSPASDMFAVGVLAYFLLTGDYPFDAALFDDEPGENVVGNPKMQAIRERLCAAAVSWSHDAFRLDSAARNLWASAMAIDAKHRPTTTEALADPWLAPAAHHTHRSRTPAASLSPPQVEHAPICLLETKASSDIWMVPAQPEDALTPVAKAKTSAHELDEAPPRSAMRQKEITDMPLPPGCIDTD